MNKNKKILKMDRFDAEIRAQKILTEKELTLQYKLEKTNSLKSVKYDNFVIEEEDEKETIKDHSDVFINQCDNNSNVKFILNSVESIKLIKTSNETPRAAYLAEIDYKWNG